MGHTASYLGIWHLRFFWGVGWHLAFAIFGRLAFGICDSGTADIWHLGIGAESNPAWHLAFAFSKALAFGIYDYATAGIWHLPAAIVEIIGGVAQLETLKYYGSASFLAHRLTRGAGFLDNFLAIVFCFLKAKALIF